MFATIVSALLPLSRFGVRILPASDDAKTGTAARRTPRFLHEHIPQLLGCVGVVGYIHVTKLRFSTSVELPSVRMSSRRQEARCRRTSQCMRLLPSTGARKSAASAVMRSASRLRPDEQVVTPLSVGRTVDTVAIRTHPTNIPQIRRSRRTLDLPFRIRSV